MQEFKADSHDGIVYRLAELKDLPEVHKQIMSEFYPHMPMYQHLQAAGDPNATRGFLAAALQQGVSLLAIDESLDRVVGVSVNTIDCRSGQNVEWPSPRWPEFAGHRIVRRCVDAVESGVDCFAEFNAWNLLSLKMLTVSASHCRRGIATKLWRLCLQLAVHQQLPLVTVSTESRHSQRIAESLGFIAVHRLRFADFVDNDDDNVEARPLTGMQYTSHQEAVMFALPL